MVGQTRQLNIRGVTCPVRQIAKQRYNVVFNHVNYTIATATRQGDPMEVVAEQIAVMMDAEEQLEQIRQQLTEVQHG